MKTGKKEKGNIPLFKLKHNLVKHFRREREREKFLLFCFLFIVNRKYKILAYSFNMRAHTPIPWQ